MLEPARLQIQRRVQRLAEGKRPGELTHVPTGLGAYDAKFGGLERGCVTLGIAHTGEGKSSLARQTMVGAAEAGVPALDLSLEDPPDRTADRILANRTGIPSKDLNLLDVDASDVARLRLVADTLPDDYYLVHKNPRATGLLDVVRSFAKQERSKGYKGPLAVCVDYMQKLAATEDALGELGNELAEWAKEEDSAVLACSQVRSDAVIQARNRFNAARPPAQRPANWQDFASYFQPHPGDAKFCRRLEESAKAVWVFFRPARWAKDFAGWDVQDDFCELHVVKANFGETGFATLGWDGQTQRIYQR